MVVVDMAIEDMEAAAVAVGMAIEDMEEVVVVTAIATEMIDAGTDIVGAIATVAMEEVTEETRLTIAREIETMRGAIHPQGTIEIAIVDETIKHDH